MTTPKYDDKVRQLPVSVYETIHFMSLVMGGIGAGNLRDPLKPRCVYQQTAALGDKAETSSFHNALASAGITKDNNDAAVRMVNKAKGQYGTMYYGVGEWIKGGKPTGKFGDCMSFSYEGCVNCNKGSDARITFEEWCDVLNIESVDDDAAEMLDSEPENYDFLDSDYSDPWDLPR